MKGKLAIRISDGNPNHHLWNNNGVWFMHYTIHPDALTKQRIRCSLQTKSLRVARRKRDQRLAEAEKNAPAEGGCRRGLRTGPAVNDRRRKLALAWMENPMKTEPRIILIAGPNGAGKTTFARQFLPNEAGCEHFINVNLLAQGLAPFAPESAAAAARRLMDRLIRGQVRLRHDFAIETTFSSGTYARRMRMWRKQGYRVDLIFLGLAAPELSVARVAVRAQQGGHAVPEPEIRRRFSVGLQHFRQHFQAAVDAWVWFDTSTTQPALVAAGGDGARGLLGGGALAALRRAGSAARQLARQTHTPVCFWQDGQLISECVDVPVETCHVA